MLVDDLKKNLKNYISTLGIKKYRYQRMLTLKSRYSFEYFKTKLENTFEKKK